MPDLPPPKYGVFLAVFPGSATASHLLKMAAAIKESHGLCGRVRPLGHLHVSLYPLGACSAVSEKVVNFVEKICAPVVASIPPFEVKFERAMSFRGGRDTHPLVLVNHGNGNAKLMRLRQALDSEFSKYRRRMGGNLKFNPHLTLLYDERTIPEEPVEPVSWVVEEIVLVFSEVGATKYERPRRWQLGG